MEATKVVRVPPDVSRVVEGLRDTGYDFNSAVADLIDNSISANATKIEVALSLSPNDGVLLAIGDNGIGMSESDLVNAMRYGSAQRDNRASLGKFGLGLKTASTAFCRRLVVVSRSSVISPVVRAAWDLDKMAASNSWDLEFTEPTSIEKTILDHVAPDGSGTVVLWYKVDRLLPNYKQSDGKYAKRSLKRLEDSLRTHLAMVFQRFLDPSDDRALDVVILVNGVRVKSWDPFAVKLTGSPVMEETVRVQTSDGETASFNARAYILPRKEEIESAEDREAARISNDLQGIYVYREQRLIHGPDWLGMYKSEPHFSLIRVDLSFGHRLDDAFQVDIKKSRILLDDELHIWLRDKFLRGPRVEAERRYRQGEAKKASNGREQLHQPADTTIHSKSASLATATVTRVDSSKNEADITNNQGELTTSIRIVSTDRHRPVRIDVAPGLDDGVLWEAAIIDGQNGVALNAKHAYYQKAYLPHRSNSIIVQALDFLLWSLAQAELNNSNPANRDALSDFRIDVSRNLRDLVADLPDPVEES